ncbi:MAG: alpha/beta fold hydrolase [Alphaproteobacteria bacterium]
MTLKGMNEFSVQNGEVTLQGYHKGEGEAIVFIHGFPDSANVWRGQIDTFVKQGYHVITLDMRGYGRSSKPKEVDSYFVTNLASDVKAVLDYLHVKQAHIVGHDWGAGVAWTFSGIYPKVALSLSVLSVGHPLSILTMPTIRQREMSWYFMFFQMPNAPEMFAADNWKLFQEFTRHHPEWLHWKEAFKTPEDITYAMNWYRATLSGKAAITAETFGTIECPVLGIWSDQDHYLTEEQMQNSAYFVQKNTSFDYIRLNNATHWLQIDKPKEVNEAILSFIKMA